MTDALVKRLQELVSLGSKLPTDDENVIVRIDELLQELCQLEKERLLDNDLLQCQKLLA